MRRYEEAMTTLTDHERQLEASEEARDEAEQRVESLASEVCAICSPCDPFVLSCE